MRKPGLARRLRLCATLFATASALVACGGGGGASSPLPPPPPAPPPATSGLVPAAPVAGAVIEADATALRVLRAGATWTYHGVDQPSGSVQGQVVYTNVVTQSAASVGVTEQSSNALDGGADTSAEQFSGGSVLSPQSLQVVDGTAPDRIAGTELRSPVRVDDQYTLYDKHFADAGADYDGDGKHDALDIAIWSRVAGTEVIDLPNRLGITAVRVDTTLDQRVLYSASSTYSDISESVRSVWYAKGIGIVQIRLDTPAANGNGVREIVTEQLDTWDGLTEGLGYLPTQAASVPGGESAGLALPTAIDAVAFADHAVAMSFIPNAIQLEGITLTSLDLQGHVLASTNQHAMALFGERVTPQKLLRVGNELRLVTLGDDGLSLVGFDANGQAMTLPKTVLVPHGGFVSDYDDQYVAAAVVGNRIWLAWLHGYQDANATYLGDLMVQSFDASGQPVGVPLTLDAGEYQLGLHTLRMSADSAHVVVSWQLGGSVLVSHYAVLDAVAGTLLADKSLLPAPVSRSNDGSTAYYQLTPLATGTGVDLVFDSDTTFGQLAGVQLDGSFDALRSNGGATLGSEVISQPWMEPASIGIAVAGTGQVFLGSQGNVQLWPQDEQATSVTNVTQLTPGAGALASTGRLALLARVPGADAQFVLPFGDRLLLVGGSPTQAMTVTPVWRLP